MLREVYNEGDCINVRELDIGMKLLFPKFDESTFDVIKDSNGSLITDSDIIIAIDDVPVDKAHQLHIIGARYEYIVTHFDDPEMELDNDLAYMMTTGHSARGQYGFYRDEENVVTCCPKYMKLQITSDGPCFWISNDNPKKDIYIDRYILLVKANK